MLLSLCVRLCVMNAKLLVTTSFLMVMVNKRIVIINALQVEMNVWFSNAGLIYISKNGTYKYSKYIFDINDLKVLSKSFFVLHDEIS